MYVKNISRKSLLFIKKNSPVILAGVASVGVVGTAVLTAKGVTKASRSLEQAKIEKGEELTKMEIIQTVVPAYIPAITLGVITVSSIIGASVISKKRQASLMGGYMMLNNSFKKYRNKVDELYGEGSDKEIDEAIMEDELKYEQPIELFYDSYSDRFFESTKFKVQQAVYFLNREMIMKDYAYLNEFYELLDIDKIEGGDELGWSTEACLQAYWQPWLDFGYSQLKTEEGQPYHKIYFFQEPMENFEDYI